MIDNMPQELIYCEAKGLNVSLSMSAQSLRARIKLRDLSVDNQILCNRRNQIIPPVPNGFEFLRFELEQTTTNILSYLYNCRVSIFLNNLSRACVYYKRLDIQLYPKANEVGQIAVHPLIVTIDHSLLLYIYSYVGWLFRHSPTAHKPVQNLLDGECPSWLDGKPQSEVSCQPFAS